MRNLMLILIAFIAVVTFIRAFDNSGTAVSGLAAEPVIEIDVNN
jgi:hypothetical protein